MGLVFSRRDRPRSARSTTVETWGPSAVEMIPRRVARPGFMPITDNTAMHNSVVWAAIRLRADLISTMPVQCYRNVHHPDGTVSKIRAPLSPFMIGPTFMEFMYSSQVELDRTGNAIGIIEELDGQDRPLKIDLRASADVEIRIKDNKISKYNIGGTEYTPDVIWHEKQFTVPGIHVGLSPVAYGVYQMGLHASIQDFVGQWFTSGQGPRASLKNTIKTLNPKEIALAQETWRASQNMGEPFVHGSDWEYKLIAAEQASADWIEGLQLSEVQVARMFGVPADLIDVVLSGRGSHITYQNTLQRNLQFLVMNLGPSVERREMFFSFNLLPRPRYVEFDESRLLRMDPQTRAQWIKTKIDSRTMTPNEARAMDNRPPLTEDDYKQFELSGLNKTASGALAGAVDIPVPMGTMEDPAPAHVIGSD